MLPAAALVAAAFAVAPSYAGAAVEVQPPPAAETAAPAAGADARPDGSAGREPLSLSTIDLGFAVGAMALLLALTLALRAASNPPRAGRAVGAQSAIRRLTPR